MQAPTYSVVIVDDQELIRTGFSMIVQSDPAITVAGEAAHGTEALELLERLESAAELPDVVLMDVRMPGMDGIEATQKIVSRYPQVRVLVLTTFDLDEYALDAVAAGASGFLLKDTRATELIAAVRTIADGDSVIAPHVTRRLLLRLHEVRGGHPARVEGTPQPLAAAAEPAGPDDFAESGTPNEPRDQRLTALTEREHEVFTLIAAGLSNAEIGAKLFLTESTVKTHVGRVLSKLSLRDRVHAVILAYELGMPNRTLE